MTFGKHLRSVTMQCLCCMCRRVLLMVLWLLIGTRLRLLAVELLSIAGPLCHAQHRYETILVTLCLMVWDWRVLRAEPTPTCWPNLFFLCLQLSQFLPSTGWLCGVGVLGLIGCSHSLSALHCRLFFNNRNNNNKN